MLRVLKQTSRPWGLFSRNEYPSAVRRLDEYPSAARRCRAPPSTPRHTISGSCIALFFTWKKLKHVGILGRGWGHGSVVAHPGTKKTV